MFTLESSCKHLLMIKGISKLIIFGHDDADKGRLQRCLHGNYVTPFHPVDLVHQRIRHVKRSEMSHLVLLADIHHSLYPVARQLFLGDHSNKLFVDSLQRRVRRVLQQKALSHKSYMAPSKTPNSPRTPRTLQCLRLVPPCKSRHQEDLASWKTACEVSEL